jgi:hypothetical protein
MIIVIWVLADLFFARTPAQMGLAPDGDPLGPVDVAPVLGGVRLWRDRRFITLAAGMAFGVCAQIGLLAHLFSLLVPALGTPFAGFAASAATAAAIGGRTLAGRLMPVGGDRRLVACASYGVQIIGSVMLLLAAGHDVVLLLFGVVLCGAGIGNATYAFAPAVFGLVRSLAPDTGDLFVATAVVQCMAIGVLVLGRHRAPSWCWGVGA